MIIRSREVALAFAAIGLLSYAACTAEKTEVKTSQAPVMTPMPKLVEGVFATDDHLQAVFFDLNKSKLSDKSMDTVKANADWLKNQPPYLIRLVGFADARGSTKKNERLAERRANTLRDAYIALGITPERVSVVTRSTDELSCTPMTEDCLAKSRKTETLLETKSLASATK